MRYTNTDKTPVPTDVDTERVQVRTNIKGVLSEKLDNQSDDIKDDIANKITEILFSPTSKTTEETKDDIENFFNNIQGGVRSFQSQSEQNSKDNLEKVKQQNPEVSNFMEEFDNMVEQIQDRFEGKSTIVESFKKQYSSFKKNIIKESKNPTSKDIIPQTRYFVNRFFESHGLNEQNIDIHDYLDNVKESEFKFLQNEGKKLFINNYERILSPFLKEQNNTKIRKLIKEGFEYNGNMMVQNEFDGIESPESQYLPQYDDSQMMDDYDFQFLYMNYLDNDKSMVVSNNPELRNKIMDLQQSIQNKDVEGEIETNWVNETSGDWTSDYQYYYLSELEEKIPEENYVYIEYPYYDNDVLEQFRTQIEKYRQSDQINGIVLELIGGEVESLFVTTSSEPFSTRQEYIQIPIK